MFENIIKCKMNNLFNIACLYTCNKNERYLRYIPYVVENCISLQIIPVILLININSLPIEYKKYQKYIRYITFEKYINDVYISQIIRLFYPAIMKEYDVVMISDIDLIIIKNNYFTNNINHAFKSDEFVVGRYKDNQCFMPFNFGKPYIWGRMFHIENIDDITSCVTKIYNANVCENGIIDWGIDQKVLTKYVDKENQVKVKIIRDEDLYALTHSKINDVILRGAFQCNFHKAFTIKNINIFKLLSQDKIIFYTEGGGKTINKDIYEIIKMYNTTKISSTLY